MNGWIYCLKKNYHLIVVARAHSIK